MTSRSLTIFFVTLLVILSVAGGAFFILQNNNSSDPVAVAQTEVTSQSGTTSTAGSASLPGTTVAGTLPTTANTTNTVVAESSTETTDPPSQASIKRVLYLDEWANREGTDFHLEAREAGFQVVQSLAGDLNFEVTRMQNADQLLSLDFSGNEPLFDVVVMWNSDGEVFDTDAKKQAFQQLIGQGTNYVGVHAASATHWEDGTKWGFYNELVGGIFDSHPPQGTPQHRQEATVIVENNNHPSTAHLSGTFQWSDEWYNFEAEPQNAQVLLSVDENSYLSQDFSQNPVSSPGNKHSVAWTKNVHGVRSFYTMLGHFGQDYSDPRYIDHIEGALAWALE